MDTKEKRKRIQTYCRGIGGSDCENCPYEKNQFCSNYNTDYCSDEIINEWYALIFGEDVIEEKTPNTRAEFLKVVEGIICKDRNAQYGEPEDNFGRIAKFWSDYLETSIDAADVAIMMSLFKIARIATGGNKSDNWIDLIGYAACGAECAVKRKS